MAKSEVLPTHYGAACDRCLHLAAEHDAMGCLNCSCTARRGPIPPEVGSHAWFSARASAGYFEDVDDSHTRPEVDGA